MVAVLCCSGYPVLAETGYEAWLRYPPIDDPNVRQVYERLPATVVTLGQSPVLAAAQGELSRGVRAMLRLSLIHI